MTRLPEWLASLSGETPPPEVGKSRKLLLYKSLDDFTAFQRQLLVRQEWCRYPGLLQSLDPRLKLVVALSMCLIAAWNHRPWLLLALLLLAGGLAGLSRIAPWRFYSWQWLVFPFFSLLATLPAMTAWITPGAPLWSYGPLVLTRPGVEIALLITLRTATSLSWVMLLISTTSWDLLLRGIRGLRVPGDLVMVFAIFLGYLLALLRRLESLHLGRLSRVLVKEDTREGYLWIGSAIASLYRITDRLGRDIGDAMEARGYSGSACLESGLVWKTRDSLALAIALVLIGGYIVRFAI